MARNIIYLHGLASSPGSKKAQFFYDRFFNRDANFRVPDLNVPDFEHLTLTTILERIAQEIRACPPGPVYLVGSSLGGMAALHFADRYQEAEARRVELMVLMAPALDFGENRRLELGNNWMEAWETAGSWPVYHYALAKECPLNYAFAEDMIQYDSFAVRVRIPILIFHGKYDTVMSCQQSVRFAEDRPNVDLHLLESDHQLLDQMETMWQTIAKFFEM